MRNVWPLHVSSSDWLSWANTTVGCLGKGSAGTFLTERPWCWRCWPPFWSSQEAFILVCSLPCCKNLCLTVTMIFISMVPFYPRVLCTALYGSQISVSFFLMLIFMTYNVSPPTCSHQLTAYAPTGLFNPQKHALQERTPAQMVAHICRHCQNPAQGCWQDASSTDHGTVCHLWCILL